MTQEMLSRKKLSFESVQTAPHFVPTHQKWQQPIAKTWARGSTGAVAFGRLHRARLDASLRMRGKTADSGITNISSVRSGCDS